MARDEIKKELTAIIADLFLLKPKYVKEESDFRNDFELDSIDEVNLMMEIETTFGISISDEEWDSAHPRTVGDTISLIEQKLSKP